MLDPSPEILRRFTYVVPDADAKAKHEAINKAFLEMATLLDATLPDGREKAIALTELQDARHWSNAAIATAPRPLPPGYLEGRDVG